jgi:hypothetical protein
VTISNDGKPPLSGSPVSRGPERPSTLVFVAVAVGGLGVGFGAAATVLMIKSKRAPIAAPALSVSAPAPEAQKEPAVEGPWTASLHAAECPAACCGGSACAVSPENAGKNRCKAGSERCDECASRITCIPGACGELVTPGIDLALYLSGIKERGPTGEPVDACRSQRDLWLCIGGADKKALDCVSQREACSNGARSPVGIPLRSEQLLKEQLLIEVREGGPDGTTVAERNSVPYRDGLQRRGLCSGMRLGFEGSSITEFTFYLDLPGEGAPAPVTGKRREAAEEVAADRGASERDPASGELEADTQAP